MRRIFAISVFACMIFAMLAMQGFAQQGDSEKELEKGTTDYQHQKYKDAEKHFRAAIKADPNSWQAHMELGDALFAQTKMECIGEYERAKEIADAAQDVTPEQKRHINDQLGVIYGMSGKFDHSIEIYRKAIVQDPDYPPYYYNLACSYSESGNLEQAIVNLQEAYKRKDKWPQYQSFPDPRKDDSFKNWLNDKRFVAALKEMGY